MIKIALTLLTLLVSTSLSADSFEAHHNNDCRSRCVGPTGPTGPAGPTGPTGPTGPAFPAAEFYHNVISPEYVFNNANFRYDQTAITDASATITNNTGTGVITITTPGVYEVSFGCFVEVESEGALTLIQLFLNGTPQPQARINGAYSANPPAYPNWVSATALVNVTAANSQLTLRNVSGHDFILGESTELSSYIIVKRIF